MKLLAHTTQHTQTRRLIEMYTQPPPPPFAQRTPFLKKRDTHTNVAKATQPQQPLSPPSSLDSLNNKILTHTHIYIYTHTQHGAQADEPNGCTADVSASLSYPSRVRRGRVAPIKLKLNKVTDWGDEDVLYPTVCMCVCVCVCLSVCLTYHTLGCTSTLSLNFIPYHPSTLTHTHTHTHSS